MKQVNYRKPNQWSVMEPLTKKSTNTVLMIRKNYCDIRNEGIGYNIIRRVGC